MTEEKPATTTIAVYLDDHAWLQKRQREYNHANNTWVTMPDLMREFILAMKESEAGA